MLVHTLADLQNIAWAESRLQLYQRPYNVQGSRLSARAV